MNRTGYQVEGLNSVTRALLALGLGLEADDLKDAFAAIAREGADVAATHAPHLSGALAGDIRGNRAKNKAVITAGRSRIPYAGAINYGWPERNIEPAGFMQIADQQMQPWALRRLEDEINQIIDRKNIR